MMIFVFVGVVLFVAAIDTSDWFMDEETEYLLYTDQDNEDEYNTDTSVENREASHGSVTETATKTKEKQTEEVVNTKVDLKKSEKSEKSMPEKAVPEKPKKSVNKGIDLDMIKGRDKEEASLDYDEFASMDVNPAQLAQDLVNDVDCQHFFRQIFLGYFSDIVQAFDTLRKNVCGDDYTSLHNPIVLSSVLPAYGMFHSIQILFL